MADGLVEIRGVAREPGWRSQDRRRLARAGRRPGRRLRRPPRLARAHGRQRAARREDRHHPVQRGAGPLRGQGARRRPASARCWWTTRTARPPSSCPTTSSRWRSASEGMNARLAARLTGWRIDIKSESTFAREEADAEYGDEAEGGRLALRGACCARASAARTPRCPARATAPCPRTPGSPSWSASPRPVADRRGGRWRPAPRRGRSASRSSRPRRCGGGRRQRGGCRAVGGRDDARATRARAPCLGCGARAQARARPLRGRAGRGRARAGAGRPRPGWAGAACTCAARPECFERAVARRAFQRGARVRGRAEDRSGARSGRGLRS